MTNHKSKALECIKRGDTCPCIKGTDPCEEHQIEAIVLALREAEISGARKMREEICEMIMNKGTATKGFRLSLGAEIVPHIRALSPESVVEG